jgi:uncharacterized protein (DUF1015 family)
MIKVKPFPAIIYNYSHKLCQPRKVICPPYDIITPVEAESYRRFSPYNMIHLTLPVRSSGRSRYRTSALLFRHFMERQIFYQETQPVIYCYQQEFKEKGARFSRLGFIACLGLDDSSSIHGHEHTRIEPKEDRFKLLVNVQANLEPIFVLFSDQGRTIRDIFKKHICSSKPLISFRDRENNTNILWRLSNSDVLRQIEKGMANKTLFIADGHHRYEVSLNYQALMRKKLTAAFKGNEDFNYIMAYFCPLESSGLVVRPVHRLVMGIDSLPMDKFRKFFYIRKITRDSLFRLMRPPVSKQRMFGVYFNKNCYIFILKNRQIMGKIDKDYRSLDISLLNHLILKGLLRVDPNNKERVIFSADTQGLIRQANIDKTSLIFFMKPVKISSIISLAGTGKKMPAKTTYFYPKVPSGLAIYKFS